MSTPASFAEFNAVPATGPTYTELARENENLRAKVTDLERQVAGHEAAMDAVHDVLDAPPEGDALEAIEALKEQVATLIAGQQRNGEARQQAFLELAQDLAEMDPAARDAAIRNIVDRAG